MGTSKLTAIRRDTIKARDSRIDSFIPKFRQIIRESGLEFEEIQEIIKNDIAGLVDLLNRQRVTSLQLIAIYGLRASIIGRQYNAVTEDYFQSALLEAKYCDKIRKQTGRRNWTIQDKQYSEQLYLPPLFGIPLSIKDNIEMKGTRSTVGLTMRANTIIEQDSPLIICIKNSGMIPFIKTNLSQLCFTYQANNLLWGRCLNPWNKNKTTGGSSGGEACLIALKCSPLGIGNDYGGSVRIPAHCCGLTALLTSTDRVIISQAITKYSKSFNGKDFIKNLNGPIGKSINDLALWMTVVTFQKYYGGYHDPYIKLTPFDSRLYRSISTVKKQHKIGFIKHLTTVQCSPACQKALLKVRKFLENEGHNVFQMNLPNQKQIIEIMCCETMSEGNLQSFRDMLEGEQLAPQYQMMSIMGKIQGLSFKVLHKIINWIQPRVGFMMNASKKSTLNEYFNNIGEGYEIRKNWFQFWKSNKLDFVVCAGFGSEAPNHGTYNDNTLLAAYTFIWNILAMTSCSIPIDLSSEQDQFYQSKWKDQFSKASKISSRNSKGLPVGIQVVGLPFNQEKVLGFSKVIESHFNFRQKNSVSDSHIIDKNFYY